MGWRDPSSSKAGCSGCLLPVQQEEKEGEISAWKQAAPEETLLSLLGFCASILAVSVLSAGQPQEWELSGGVQLRQTLVFLLSCWELPPLSFLASETKVTESPGRCLRCGLSPGVGELYKLQTSLWQWS